MKEKERSYLADVLWLLLAIMITLLTCIFVLDWKFTDTIDIHLSDTFFITRPAYVMVTLFLLIAFPIFSIREVWKGLPNRLTTVFLFISGFLLLIMFAFAQMELTMMGTRFYGGWTSYPPLSSPGQTELGERRLDPLFKSLIHFFLVLQLCITGALIYLSYCLGKLLLK